MFIILFITALHTRYQATKSSCHFSSKSRFSYTLFYFTVFCHQSHFPLIPAHNHQKLHLALHASSQHRSFVSLLRHQHFISFHNNPPIPPPSLTSNPHPDRKTSFYLTVSPHKELVLLRSSCCHKAFQVHILTPQVISFQTVTLSNLHVTSAPHTITAPCHFRSTHHHSFISLQILTPPKLISDPHTTKSFDSLQTLTPAKLPLTSHFQAPSATFHFTFSPVCSFWINSTEFFCLNMYGLWAGGSKHRHSPYQQNLKQNVFKASLPSFPAPVCRVYSTLTIPPGPARLVSPIRSRSI